MIVVAGSPPGSLGSVSPPGAAQPPASVIRTGIHIRHGNDFMAPPWIIVSARRDCSAQDEMLFHRAVSTKRGLLCIPSMRVRLGAIRPKANLGAATTSMTHRDHRVGVGGVVEPSERSTAGELTRWTESRRLGWSCLR